MMTYTLVNYITCVVVEILICCCNFSLHPPSAARIIFYLLQNPALKLVRTWGNTRKASVATTQIPLAVSTQSAPGRPSVRCYYDAARAMRSNLYCALFVTFIVLNLPNLNLFIAFLNKRSINKFKFVNLNVYTALECEGYSSCS